jgi:cystathionine beta-lyase/cystathionine gamma-synthase
MTHGSIPKEVRDARGVTDELLRLSVGIEDVDDLIDDLRQNLDATADRSDMQRPLLA